ncbi:MAG: hypothetical protein CM1200mP8_2060 [Chloroflexota bacterium]|nr:MAG: hypothetical protein CM1200mP8_2060 [Chloroflexota bacterium]
MFPGKLGIPKNELVKILNVPPKTTDIFLNTVSKSGEISLKTITYDFPCHTPKLSRNAESEAELFLSMLKEKSIHLQPILCHPQK